MLTHDNEYDSIAEAVAAGATNLKLNKDVTEAVVIENGKTLTIDGQNHTITGNIKTTPVDNGSDTGIVLKHVKVVAGSGQTFGIHSQDQESLNPNKFNVTLEDVVVSGFTTKGLYMTNPGDIQFTDVLFENCGSDYAIDFNTCAVQGIKINFNNVQCTGTGATKAMAKVTQRGGDDDYAHDIFTGLHKWDGEKYVDNEGGKQATIATFNVTDGIWTMDSTDVAICIGSSPNSDAPIEPADGPRTSNGNFPYIIACGGKAKVRLRHQGEDVYEMK